MLVGYLQLSPGVRQVVDFVMQVAVETAPAPLQRLGSAQQTRLFGLHHPQLDVAALKTQDTHASASTLGTTPAARRSLFWFPPPDQRSFRTFRRLRFLDFFRLFSSIRSADDLRGADLWCV